VNDFETAVLLGIIGIPVIIIVWGVFLFTTLWGWDEK